MTTKAKKEAAKKAEEKWEISWLESREKSKVKKILSEMQLPSFDVSFTGAKLMKFADNVCLQLMPKDPRWEMFLSDPIKKKCKRYMKL